MKVADLQKHLGDLATLLGSAGVKKEVVSDLNAIRDGLIPFRDLPLKGFADFIVRAEAYRSSGEVPSTASTNRRKQSGATGTKAAAPDIQSLAQEVKQLYDQAANPSTTEASIDALLERLGSVDKKGLVTVAEAIELRGVNSKTKPGIISAIRQRILARKGSTQRVGLLDRPTPTEVGELAAADSQDPVGANQA